MIYSFRHGSLDTDRRECRRGGELVTVEPQVFDILVYLIRNRERVVSNDELTAAVWNGRIVSESTLSSRISLVRQAVGDSGERQDLIRTFSRKGYRFIGEVREEQPRDVKIQVAQPHSTEPPADEPWAPGEQTTTFCRTKDGVNIAIASVGLGPVLVRAAHWATNIERDWQNPVTGPLLRRIANRFRLIRYDGRGTGLSDRQVPGPSFATMLDDFETAVDSMALDRFDLLGISAGAATSIAYAARHPERVSKLVLCGSYALGRNHRGSSQVADEAKAFLTMVRSGWDEENSTFIRAFYSFWLPAASPEQLQSFIDYQRQSHSGDFGVKLRMAVDDIDITGLLPEVCTPTLVFHSSRDALVPFDQGRLVAASIPNARFVALDSGNHALIPGEPAWAKFVGEMEAFLLGAS